MAEPDVEVTQVVVHDPSIPDLAQRGLEAAQASQWIVVTAVLVLGIVAAIRKYGGAKYEALDRGYVSFIVSMLVGMATQITVSAASGDDLSTGPGLLAACINGAVTGLTASGIYSGGKSLGKRAMRNEAIRRAGSNPNTTPTPPGNDPVDPVDPVI